MSSNLLHLRNIDENIFSEYRLGIDVRYINAKIDIHNSFLEIESKEIFVLIIEYIKNKLSDKKLNSHPENNNLFTISLTKFDLMSFASYVKDKIINYSLSINSKDYDLRLKNVYDEFLKMEKTTNDFEIAIVLNKKDYLSNLEELLVNLFWIATNNNFNKKCVCIYLLIEGRRDNKTI